MSNARTRKYLIFFVSAGIVLVLDQLSKWLVMEYMPAGAAISIIPGFFDLVNIRNRGAAFGFLNRQDIEWQFWLFLFATVIAAWAIFAILRKSEQQPWLSLGLGLIFGGALGNLVDRVRFRAVVDFLDIYWQDWHWPAFNIADSGICIGAAIVCLAIWRKPQGEDV